MGSCYNGLACGHAVWPAVVWGAVATLVTAPCMQGELRLSEPCQPSVSRMTAAIQPRVSLGHITRLPASSLCVISVHVHDRKTLYPSAYARTQSSATQSFGYMLQTCRCFGVPAPCVKAPRKTSVEI